MPAAHGYNDAGDEIDAGTLLDVISASKKSILGHGTITFQVKQTRMKTAPSLSKFSLAVTISALQMMDIASENLLEEGAVFILVYFTWNVMVPCPRMLFLEALITSSRVPASISSPASLYP